MESLRTPGTRYRTRMENRHGTLGENPECTRGRRAGEPRGSPSRSPGKGTSQRAAELRDSAEVWPAARGTSDLQQQRDRNPADVKRVEGSL
ncbi:hypothetical protein EYF80_065434 [Liparis tanakae]|uniref:Uncharacterized protein n=1 Tax=Liparis tanakae TaxID=230148 RepID=A0A4Z2E6Q8_9TELE|nr:hypothetical protein EYF80_065434 [Liparis tanakae]